MGQHILSEWLIKPFTHPTKRGNRLTTYNKATNEYGEVAPRHFLAPENDHSDEIEQELNRIESPAAAAARHLHDLTTSLPPGICRVGDRDDPDLDNPNAQVRAGGRAAGFELLVVDRQIAQLPPAEKKALAKFVALMFTRAPKVERAITIQAAAFSRGVDKALMERGLMSDERAAIELAVAVESARWLGLRDAATYAERLAARQWWVLKADEDQKEEFILGDTPVVPTLALGHDDEWRPLFHAATSAVVMPLSPSLTLMIADLIPVGGNSLDFVASINRLSWKHADEQVIGVSRAKLEEVRGDLAAHGWRESAPVPIADEMATEMRGRRYSALWSLEWQWRQGMLPGQPIYLPLRFPDWPMWLEDRAAERRKRRR